MILFFNILTFLFELNPPSLRSQIHIFVENVKVMKLLKAVILVGTLCVALIACKSSDTDNKAQDYYNQVDTIQNTFKTQLNNAYTVLEGDISSQAADSIKNNMLAIIDSSKSKLNSVYLSIGDEGLKESFNNLLSYYHKTFTEAYPKIFAIRFDKAKQTEENVVILSEIIRTIDADEAGFASKFINAQKSFKAKHSLP